MFKKLMKKELEEKQSAVSLTESCERYMPPCIKRRCKLPHTDISCRYIQSSQVVTKFRMRKLLCHSFSVIQKLQYN